VVDATGSLDPYEELPYRSRPIEWSAPERLTLCSMLHGGPRPSLRGYRVLELGCGNGANLLPLAFYRRDATFVGVDGSARAIATAEDRRHDLALENLRFIHADFASASLTPETLGGPFEFVLVHGVFSWVSAEVRDRLLDLCCANLARGGLLYLNYNCRPGWDVRGIVRHLLLAQTTKAQGLRARAALALQVASTVASGLHGVEHPYAQLMERELRFVSGSDASYVAHEFLAPHNYAYWRSEWLGFMAQRGLAYIADADFNYDSGRTAPELTERIASCGLDAQPVEDLTDLLAYRQLHTAIFTQRDAPRRPFAREELAELYVAAPLRPIEGDGNAPRFFQHPAGFQVEAREPPMWRALDALGAVWPRGLPAREVLEDVHRSAEDLLLLQRHGAIELRLVEPESPLVASELCQRELRWGAYSTDPYHHLELHSPRVTLTDV
jgi:SAM-dependent methyltransferase